MTPPAGDRPLRVALLDYGVGNLHSLAKALEGGGARVETTREWSAAVAADALVLPGVGAFSAAARTLGAERPHVRAALDAGLPCLGICLGMQLLFEESAEGEGKGIGHFAGHVRRLETRMAPQMGWSSVETSDDALFRRLPELTAWYAHSFVCAPDDPSVTIARTRHDDDPFPAAVRRKNTWGVQFHPEKSSTAGRRLIANFLAAARTAHPDRRIR